MSKKFEEAGIIPDLYEEFAESEANEVLKVDFYDLYVEEGNEIRPAKARDPPRLVVENAEKDKYYHVIMVDPDAPSRENPSKGPWRHYIYANIPGSTGKGADGETVESYQGPAPPESTGLHRYIFLLYKTEDEEDFVAPASTRSNWNYKKFCKSWGIGTPITANWFVSQNDKQ